MSEVPWMWMAWGALAGAVVVYGWVWKKAGERGRAWREWGLAAVVAVVSAVSVALHEPWRDEVHAWLQAREMGLGALWTEMACEGHFIPWHLLLWPLAHFGAPVWTMGAVSWALNAVAVWWLSRKSPLTGWEKAAAGMSCLFLYVNPVVSRCYVLVPLALFGIAALWGRRDERPVAFGLWVALLANTHVAMEGAAAAAAGVFAWENVLRRKDGKGWRECGRQWAGLGTMAAGGLLAAAQVVPSLWRSSVALGEEVYGVAWHTARLFQPCVGGAGAGGVATVAGLAVLGGLAWRKDKGVFWVYAVSLGYLWGFAVFLYAATVWNRALLWWPVALSAAWMLAGERRDGERWRILAVAVAGLALTRPDLTLWDWHAEFDALPGACRWIAERHGEDAEVWINGDDVATEGTAAYLENVRDWRNGRKASPVSWGTGKGWTRRFEECRAEVFRDHPAKGSFLALGSAWAFSGLEEGDFSRPGVEVERTWARGGGQGGEGFVLMRVWRWGGEWGPFGAALYHAGDRRGAVAAWKREVEEEAGAWEAMNNLAWAALEEGRLAEAREWIDRAMEFKAARENAVVRDTETRVRRKENEAME